MHRVSCSSWLILLILTFWQVNSFAQTGSLVVANYFPAEHSFDNYNYDVLENKDGLILIANRQGLLTFDGTAWELTPTPYALFFIEESEDGTVFAGGRAGFGKFVKGDDLELQFQPIDSTYRDLFGSHIQGDTLYIINEDKLIIHDIPSSKTMFMDIQEHGEYEEVNGNESTVWVSTSKSGLLEIDGVSLSEPVMQPTSRTEVKRSNEYGESIHFTLDGQIYIETSTGFRKLNIKDEGYLDLHRVIQIEWIDNKILAACTLTGGIAFINTQNGELLGISNYESGLPDEEILSMSVDHNQALWITHSKGVSIISPLLPVEDFSHFRGLEGDLLQIAYFKNSTYVATSTGVYVLLPKPTFEEETILVQETVENSEQKRTGLFGRRKKRRESIQPQTQTVTKTVKKLVGVEYEFQRINGVETKTTQLLVFNDRLFAASQSGAFQINGIESEKILNSPVEHIFGDNSSGLLFISTSEETTHVLELVNGKWTSDNLLEGLNDLVGQMISDQDGLLWLCGADSVYRIELENKELRDVSVYQIRNPHFEKLHASIMNDQIVFTNSSGYYVFDGDSIVRSYDIEEDLNLATGFLTSSKGDLWIRTPGGWYGSEKGSKNTLDFLSIIPDPRALDVQNDSTFWVITSKNELYRVNSKQFSSFKPDRKLFLKHVRTGRRKLNVDDIYITQDEGELSFEFVRPDYMQIYGMVFQYRLRGLSNEWSTWSSSNNVITYPFLPPNSYSLELRTRDALGNIEVSDPINFMVQAPYWRRPWFYALELCFFGGLLFFSFRLNRKSERYTVMSRLLSFMTLILIVEFFQTIAEAKFETDESPVIDFFIQAFIALLILPVESIIRRFIGGNNGNLESIKLPGQRDHEEKEND